MCSFKIPFICLFLSTNLLAQTWTPGNFEIHGLTVGKPIELTGSVEDRARVRAASANLLDRIGALAKRSEQRMEAREETRRMKAEAWARFERALP